MPRDGAIMVCDALICRRWCGCAEGAARLGRLCMPPVSSLALGNFTARAVF
jgi:hypothetical protein